MTSAKKWLLSVSIMWVISSALAQGQESTEQPPAAPDASSTEVAATSTEEEDYDDYMDYAEFVEVRAGYPGMMGKKSAYSNMFSTA